MSILDPKQARRQKIRYRIRKKIQGTAARPRLVVTKSNRLISAQIIDDQAGHTLAHASSHALKSNNQEAARKVGEQIAIKALEKGIQQVVFDRAGYLYHGKVKQLSEAAKAKGLKH